jgi:preprotein translocase subunit SecG
MNDVLVTLIYIVHVFVCLFLMLVVLLQQGKGGGMGAAFGGGAAAQVFGGSGAGNILTRATAVCAALFMLTSVSLAYQASSGDRALKAREINEAKKVKDRPLPQSRPVPPLLRLPQVLVAPWARHPASSKRWQMAIVDARHSV